nr:hypothetical protein CFP56_06500 [Quercus suber]
MARGLELASECSIKSRWLKTLKSSSRSTKEDSHTISYCSSSKVIGSFSTWMSSVTYWARIFGLDYVLRGLKIGGYGSVSEDYVGGSELTVLVEEDLGLQNPINVLKIHQIAVLGGEMFIYKKFKKEILGVGHISL